MTSRLTVIVPTRERADTLVSSLRTCTTQDCDELAILVSDNASTDSTREVVASHDDPRIRYVNPGRRLGMSEHWEFALSHVDDGYVSFLGDDDGLMPGAASELLEVLDSESADALIWPLSSYYWPQFFDPAMANCLSMRLPQEGRLTRLDSARTLAQVARFETPHYFLPSPYWGAVHRSCLTRMGRGGRVFGSIIPDVYSGVGVAAVTTSYLRSDRLYSLSGSSRHSNGASQMTGKDKSSVDSPAAMFEAENALPFHPRLDYTTNVAVLVAECLLQAHDQVSAAVPLPELDTMFRAAVRHPDHVLSPAVQAGVEESLRRTAARHGHEAILDRELRTGHRRALARRASAALRLIVLGNPLHDCEPDGVADIYGATVVADRLRTAHSSALARTTWTVRGRALKAGRALSAARARSGPANA